MNKVVDRFLKIGDKFMPEMHARQPDFTCSACGAFTKNKQRIQKFIETGDTKFTEMNWTRLVFSMIWLILASMVYKSFEKKSKGAGIKNEIKENQQLANELHKPIIRKFKIRRVYSSFKDNIWGAGLADMQIISKYNKGLYIFYVLLICSVNMLLLFL